MKNPFKRKLDFDMDPSMAAINSVLRHNPATHAILTWHTIQRAAIADPEVVTVVNFADGKLIDTAREIQDRSQYLPTIGSLSFRHVRLILPEETEAETADNATQQN